MKLRNKKTGEIKEFALFDGNELQGGATLESLTEEWEDVPEESKEYWYIDCYGEVLHAFYNGNEWDERRKEIGNYFESKEEAERAVEKLKAWKRLKDKGFRFGGISNYKINFEFEERVMKKGEVFAPQKDLDLLFSGGEE